MTLLPEAHLMTTEVEFFDESTVRVLCHCSPQSTAVVRGRDYTDAYHQAVDWFIAHTRDAEDPDGSCLPGNAPAGP